MKQNRVLELAEKITNFVLDEEPEYRTGLTALEIANTLVGERYKSIHLSSCESL